MHRSVRRGAAQGQWRGAAASGSAGGRARASVRRHEPKTASRAASAREPLRSGACRTPRAQSSPIPKQGAARAGAAGQGAARGRATGGRELGSQRQLAQYPPGPRCGARAESPPGRAGRSPRGHGQARGWGRARARAVLRGAQLLAAAERSTGGAHLGSHAQAVAQSGDLRGRGVENVGREGGLLRSAHETGARAPLRGGGGIAGRGEAAGRRQSSCPSRQSRSGSV